MAVWPKIRQVGKFERKLVVDGTKMDLHTKFHVNRCFRLRVVNGYANNESNSQLVDVIMIGALLHTGNQNNCLLFELLFL